jgi:hypothetical protein
MSETQPFGDVPVVGVAFGEDDLEQSLFVAIDTEKRYSVSRNGIDWESVYTLTGDYDFEAITYFNRTFVILCSNGVILRSVFSNGEVVGFDEQADSPNITAYCNDIAGGNDLYAAVGNEGKIRISPDASHFSAADSPTAEDLFSETFGKGKFLIGGANNTLIAGTNGTDFQKIISPFKGSAAITGTGYSQEDGLYIVTNADGEIATSADLETWSNHLSPSTVRIKAVTSGSNRIVLGDDSGNVYSSRVSIEIKLPDVDLTNYATKQYVDDAVANIESGNGSGGNCDCDLTGYATEEWVQEKIDGIEIGDSIALGDYATKEYVDAAVANIESGSGTADAVEWENVQNKPETFPPNDHTQPVSSVIGAAAVIDIILSNTQIGSVTTNNVYLITTEVNDPYYWAIEHTDGSVLSRSGLRTAFTDADENVTVITDDDGNVLIQKFHIPEGLTVANIIGSPDDTNHQRLHLLIDLMTLHEIIGDSDSLHTDSKIIVEAINQLVERKANIIPGHKNNDITYTAFEDFQPKKESAEPVIDIMDFSVTFDTSLTPDFSQLQNGEIPLYIVFTDTASQSFSYTLDAVLFYDDENDRTGWRVVWSSVLESVKSQTVIYDEYDGWLEPTISMPNPNTQGWRIREYANATEFDLYVEEFNARQYGSIVSEDIDLPQLLAMIEAVPDYIAGTNITITDNGNNTRTISATGSGGGGGSEINWQDAINTAVSNEANARTQADQNLQNNINLIPAYIAGANVTITDNGNGTKTIEAAGESGGGTRNVWVAGHIEEQNDGTYSVQLLDENGEPNGDVFENVIMLTDPAEAGGISGELNARIAALESALLGLNTAAENLENTIG